MNRLLSRRIAVREDIDKRVSLEAEYIISTHSTLRQTAKLFGVSKSTVHVDMSQRLKKINGKKYKKIEKILQINFAEKHIRGGKATKEKYLYKL